MENNKINKYIEEGKEKELLDKLMIYSFDEFNPQMQNLLKILLVMIEKARDPIAPHQFFYKAVLTVLPEIIAVNEKLTAFVALLKLESLSPYQQTSFLVREFIIGVEDSKFNEAEYKEEKITQVQLSVFKTEMSKLNVFFLEKAIAQRLEHNQIMSIFYSCVSRLEAERKIIISIEAITLLRKYLLLNPEGYVKNFIRPLYSGSINNGFPEYFLHVAEPFYAQIFDLEFSFESFLEVAREKKIDEKLVNDVEAFYKKIKDRPVVDGNKSLMLKNPLISDGLEMKSNLHNGIRY